MFNNIGRKIKGLAIIIFWISLISGAIASIVCGIVLFTEARWDGIYVLYGIGAIILGCGVSFLVSWIGSFFMYGFGQLIDDTQINRQTNQRILQRLEGGSAPVMPNPESFRSDPRQGFERPVPPAAPVAESAPVRPAAPAGWYCKMCGAKNDAEAKFCLRCGTPNDDM